MAVTRLFTPRPYDSFDPGISGVAPILATGTDVDNTKLTAVQAAAAAAGLGTLPTSAGGSAPSPTSAVLRFRGAWQANTAYQYGDVVQIVDGSSNVLAYSANLNFTSGSTFNATNWTELTYPGGSAASLPDQTGNNGKFLTTNGSAPAWATVAGGSGVATVINVKDAAYGAVGDGTTDDVTAIQAAVTAAKLAGGPAIIYFPLGTYKCSGSLNFDASTQIILRGAGGRHDYNGSSGRCALVYSGTGSGTFISARKTLGFTIENLAVVHSSGSFTGKLVDASATSSAQADVTVFFTVRDAMVGGQTNALHTCTAVYLDGIVEGNFDNASIANASVGVQGMAASGGGVGFANAVEFRGGTFDHCDTAVLNPFKQWSFHQVTFEPAASGAPSPVKTGASRVVRGLSFTDCGFWDASVAGTWIDVDGDTLKVSGCFQETTAAVILATMETTSGFTGAELSGNFLDGGSLYAIAGGGNVTDLRIGANSYKNGAVEKSGTSSGKAVYTLNRAFDSITALGTVTTTLVCTDSAIQTATLGGSPTVTMPANIVTGYPYSFTLRLSQDGTGSRTVTWPGSVAWGTAGAPVLSSAINKTDYVTFTTIDGGTTWHGFLAGKGF